MKKSCKFNYDLGNFYPEQIEHDLSLDQLSQVKNFHKLYFNLLEKKSGLQISWLGHQTGKTPLDMWLYQEFIVKNKPDLIIETGTHWGGSAIFFATICNLINFGEVLSIDLYPKEELPRCDNLSYIHGSSIDNIVKKKVEDICKKKSNILVILDSNHKKDHVLEELRFYSKFIPKGGLIIVEDTFLNGHPSHKNFGPGPYEAVEIFLKENSSFKIDRSYEKFMFTLNYNGFLRKID